VVQEDGALAWSEGRPRPFLALQADAGTVLHLRGVGGWGLPWWTWGGLIADGWLDGTMFTGTAGARLSLILVNLDLHWRATRYWDRVAMPPLDRHTELATGGTSTNHAWDLDLWGVAPTPGGYLAWEVLGSRMLGRSGEVHVYDEAVHAIVQPPWSGFASLGWAADLAEGAVQAGASADLAYLGRGGELRLRAGPLASWAITPAWSLRAQLLFTITSPDALKLWSSLGGGLTVGYRTATGVGRLPGPAAAAQ
jgi:hypothetical protein